MGWIEWKGQGRLDFEDPHPFVSIHSLTWSINSSFVHVFVLREKQESALCGTHCINNLLQGPYYNEAAMAEIAHSLDQRERSLMMESGVDSADFLAYAAADSSNVDASGNFSIEVLSESLSNFGLSCVNIASPDCKHVRDNPLDQTGYICNFQSHWLAIRKLHGRWFNLNSLQSENNGWGPSYITDLYLSLYLQELRSRRYTIFVVTGNYPQVDPTAEGEGRWFDSNQVIDYTMHPQKLKAIQASQSRVNAVSPSACGGDVELARALAASVETIESGGMKVWSGPTYFDMGPTASATRPSRRNTMTDVDDEDEDMRRAIMLSMQDAMQTQSESSEKATSSSTAPPVTTSAADIPTQSSATASTSSAESSSASLSTIQTNSGSTSNVGGQPSSSSTATAPVPTEAMIDTALAIFMAASAAATVHSANSPSQPPSTSATVVTSPPASTTEFSAGNTNNTHNTNSPPVSTILHESDDDDDSMSEEEQMRRAIEMSMQQE